MNMFKILYPPKNQHDWLENPPYHEDVFPIEHGDFAANHVSFQGCHEHPPGGLSPRPLKTSGNVGLSRLETFDGKKKMTTHFCLKETVDGSEF